MDLRANPFYEVYVGERISESDYVTIFSPILVDHVEALFLPGNVVLKGGQGSGKSMLLSLLKPEVRTAYLNSKQTFPVPQSLRNFIGAGINLNLSGAIDFSQRPIIDQTGDPNTVAPLYFADFFNHWIVKDILKNIESIGGYGSNNLGIENIDCTLKKLDYFAQELSKDDCWFGSLGLINNFYDLKQCITNRIISYRSYLQYNCNTFPETIINSKTRINDPVSATVRALRTADIVSDEVNFFVHIDQYEELCRLEGNDKILGPRYRQIINKALSSRDGTISYRVGTRGYAWYDDLTIYGSDHGLEENRDYKLIDLDWLLRRNENSKTWIFPPFAEDVFFRRLNFAGFNTKEHQTKDLILYTFGKGMTPEEKAKRYTGSSPRRAIKTYEHWPTSLKEFLLETVESNPLSARLLEAWILQNENKIDFSRHINFGEILAALKPYWKKERNELALIQIASRCQQNLYLSGKDEILQLSGGNILVFLSLCQNIWTVWLRAQNKKASDIVDIPEIGDTEQTLGIRETSTRWIQKITEEGRGGNARCQFIKYLGTFIYKKLSEDQKLSYPGNNGFSIPNEQLISDSEEISFLKDLTDYGNLFESQHTTKEKNKKPRTKWYLQPIFCPYFKIPYKRIKEPIYLNIDEFYNHLVSSGIIVNSAKRATKGNLRKDIHNTNQYSLL